MTPPTVNAYYNPLQNSINFRQDPPAALLTRHGRAVNFGVSAR